MNRLVVWLIAVLFLVDWLPLQAQYVRRVTYRTDHHRRMQYALDDWVSYMKSKHISSIAVGSNYIYFATLDGGILRYHLYENYWDYPYTTSNGLSSNRVLDVAYDDDTGYLWAVTSVDTCIYKPAEEEWLCKKEADFWSYKFPERPQPGSSRRIEYNVFYPKSFLDRLPLYFANGDYTLTGEWKIMDQYFDEYPVTGFLRDHWERIWFVIEGLGIGIGNTFSQRIDVFPFGLTNIQPRSLQYHKNDLWIGGLAREGEDRPGIVHWRDRDGGWEYFQERYISQLPSDNVWDIEITGDSVWFATDYGLSLYDTRKNRWKNYQTRDGLVSQQILDLMTAGGTLYIGTRDGLNTLELASGKIQRVKDSTIRVATVYQIAAQEDTIWAATNRGILRHRPGNPAWEQVTPDVAIQEMPVTAVAVYRDEVWFASPGGIFWLDTRRGKWESFPQIGLDVRGPFRDLAVNQLSVWATTGEGLLKYDRLRKYWRLFTREDGLLANECYQLLMDGDYMWIANRRGITQFYWNNPQRID